MGDKTLYFGDRNCSIIKSNDIDVIFQVTSEFSKKIAILPGEKKFAVIAFEGINFTFSRVLGDLEKAVSPEYCNILDDCKIYSQELMKNSSIFYETQKKYPDLRSEITKVNYDGLSLKLSIVGPKDAVFQDIASYVLSSILKLHSEKKKKDNQIRAGD